MAGWSFFRRVGIGVAMLGLGAATRLEAECPRPGDFNLDVGVDVLDLVLLQGFIVGNVSGLPGCVGFAGVARSGQKGCYDATNVPTACPGLPAGQDGALQKGVAYPTPRFVDNLNGTVKDNLTSLVWLKDANCFDRQTWNAALTMTSTLSSGTCGLTDGSVAGAWRVPNQKELQTLIDLNYFNPAISNAAGTGVWTPGNPFVNIEGNYYWTSTTAADTPGYAWYVYLYSGFVNPDSKDNQFRLWPVRGGQ